MNFRSWFAFALLLVSGCYDARGVDDAAARPVVDGGGRVDAHVAPDAGPVPMPPPPAAPHLLRCDGDEESVRVELGDALGGAEAVTFELWFRFARVLPWDAPRETLLHGFDGSGRGPNLRIEAEGFSFEEYRSIGASIAVQTLDGEAAGGHGSKWLAPLDEEWHHFAAVADGSVPGETITIYYDGQPKPRSVGPEDEVPDVDVRELLLCVAIGGSPFDGWIDDVRISRTRRYGREAFVPPARPLIDDDTALILDFDGGEAVDRSGNGHPVTTANVELVSGSPRP